MPEQRKNVVRISVDETRGGDWGEGYEVTVHIGGEWDWKTTLIGTGDFEKIADLGEALRRGFEQAEQDLMAKGKLAKPSEEKADG